MRLLHKLIAKAGGFFWLPCPVCGRMFGGNEIRKVFTASLVIADGSRRVVCPDPMCSHDAAVLNIQNGHDVWLRSNVRAKQEPTHDQA